MHKRVTNAIFKATNYQPVHFFPMGGGCIGHVYRVALKNGHNIVAKIGDTSTNLDIEGFMLEAVEPYLPVPHVLLAEPDLLLMSYIKSDGQLNRAAQIHAAEILARLHEIKGPAYGLQRDTLIGGLHQPNPQINSWIDFFRDWRLLYMGRQVVEAGRMNSRLLTRLENLSVRLEEWIEEPEYPSLLHGDMWTGNVLCCQGRITGFIDPAIYYGDPEIELAFSTLFGTFGDAFFGRYQELRSLGANFFEERCDLYNLYPLLVHVYLFGSSYIGSVERTLAKFGV